MGDRNQLHDLRNQAHKAGVEGSSKMSESQLKQAMREHGQGHEADDGQAGRPVEEVTPRPCAGGDR